MTIFEKHISLPFSVKTSNSVYEFKSKLKSYFFYFGMYHFLLFFVSFHCLYSTMVHLLLCISVLNNNKHDIAD